jgi:CoA:oxalate CoA-transferase
MSPRHNDLKFSTLTVPPTTSRKQQTMSSPTSLRPAGPFSGVLVVDLTHVLNGPFGTTFLNDLGARVIKIEPPGHGDDTRTYGPFVKDQSLYFSFVNRGKESIVLDLKNTDDRIIFLEMVKQADVLTENYRPGTMAKLGFSYEALSKINPRLIYAASSGFGQTGPLSKYPAYDTIVQAMSGIMSLTGKTDGPPTRVGTSISDLLGGVCMFGGIASALYAREKTGKGAFVDIAMFDSTMAFLPHGWMEYVATQHTSRYGNRHPYMTPFDVFETADGHVAICAGNDHLFRQLVAAVGREDLATDQRFASNADRTANQTALKVELEAALKQHTDDYWVDAIHTAGVPVGLLMKLEDLAEHPQTKARNMLIEAGGVRMPGNPVKISGYEDPPVRTGAPTLDEHGDALRREFLPPASLAAE